MRAARVIAALFFFIPSLTFAQEAPKVVTVTKGQPAPFAGTLLNPAAVAHTIADKESTVAQCKLTQTYIEKREKASCDLMVGSIQASLDALKGKHDSILMIKNEEIERLHKIAADRPNQHNHWWFAGGLVAGIVTSVVIFYAAVEVSD